MSPDSGLRTPPGFEYKHREFWRNPPAGALGPYNQYDPAASPELTRQEQHLATVLKRLFPKAPPQSIFEAGCGQGRIAKFFAFHWPEATYEAIDISASRIEDTARVRPDATLSVADFTSHEFSMTIKERYLSAIDFDGFDIVIASEVLMHIPDEQGDLAQAINNLLDLTSPRGYLVTIDWVPLPKELARLKRLKGGIAPWNFPHDYDRAFRQVATHITSVRTDQQMIHVWRP